MWPSWIYLLCLSLDGAHVARPSQSSSLRKSKPLKETQDLAQVRQREAGCRMTSAGGSLLYFKPISLHVGFISELSVLLK